MGKKNKAKKKSLVQPRSPPAPASAPETQLPDPPLLIVFAEELDKAAPVAPSSVENNSQDNVQDKQLDGS